MSFLHLSDLVCSTADNSAHAPGHSIEREGAVVSPRQQPRSLWDTSSAVSAGGAWIEDVCIHNVHGTFGLGAQDDVVV